ncbi:hypothetical protein OBBRIDRAFT_704695, partial [Obba rivulosa]
YAYIYLTIACMVLDALSIPTIEVPCESLLFQVGRISTNYWSHLGSDVIEWIQVLQYHWKDKIVDYAQVNSTKIEEV